MITVKVHASVARTQVQLNKEGDVPRAVFSREFRFASLPFPGTGLLLPMHGDQVVQSVVRAVTQDLSHDPPAINLIAEVPGLPTVPFEQLSAMFTEIGWERAQGDQVIV